MCIVNHIGATLGHFGANGGILPRFRWQLVQNVGHFVEAWGAMALGPQLDQPMPQGPSIVQNQKLNYFINLLNKNYRKKLKIQ